MSQNPKSFKLRYRGSRFEGARLPVDVLSDLSAFRDLLLSFAKDEFKRRNPDRTRVPKGFEQSLSLDLVRIEDGSAIPQLDWNRDTAQKTLPTLSDEIEELVDDSYQKIAVLFDEAGNGRFPRTLATEHIRALNKFGSSLKTSERIEFLDTSDDGGNVVYLNPERRRSLITNVRETYQERADGIGELRGYYISDSMTGVIILKTSDYGQIDLPIDPDRISEEFDGNMFADVQFSIQVELTHEGRFRKVADVFSVDIVDTESSEDVERCFNRIQDIKDMEGGWLDGYGKSISEQAISNCVRFVKERPEFAGYYQIFPGDEGDIQIEMQKAGWDYTIEFRPDGSIEFYGIEIDGPKEIVPETFVDLSAKFLARFDSIDDGDGGDNV